jgi:hypothetical protein
VPLLQFSGNQSGGGGSQPHRRFRQNADGLPGGIGVIARGG